MSDNKVWARVFGDNYKYKKDERIRLIKSFKRPWDKGSVPRGYVYNVKEDLGKLVAIEIDYRDGELIPKAIIEPFPFRHFRRGQRVRVKRTINCEGACTLHATRNAYCSIRKGRVGKIGDIEDFGTFHRLLYVTFRGGDKAVYEDWEVDSIHSP